MDAKRPAEWPVLAGVRFVMALAVVNYHLFITGATEGSTILAHLGSQGCICGFLVISGYSIAHSITNQPKGFLMRRAWRILPIYYAVLLFSIVPYLWTHSPTPFRSDVGGYTKTEILGSIFMLQCFVTTKLPVFGPSWTLAIEWWFYVSALLWVRAKNWVLYVVFFGSVYLEQRLLDKDYYPFHEHTYGIPGAMLLWAWLAGFLYYKARGWSAAIIVVAGTYAVSIIPDGGTELPFIIASFAVIQAKTLPPIPSWLARILNYLGDLSYPLYLVHVPLMLWFGRWTHWPGRFRVWVGVSLLASAVLYHFVDSPLRSRFSTRRPKPVEKPAPPLPA